MADKYMVAPYIMERTVNELRVADILRMTHLNIAFCLIKDGKADVSHLEYLDRIAIYKRINPNLKVIISIGGWGADGFSQAAMTEEGRILLSKTAMDIVLKWDFDGVDIDWEYPCLDDAEIACDPRDKENYTLLLAQLRADLDKLGTGKKYTLSVAVGGEEYFVKNTEMDKCVQYLDYVNLMTYDLRGGFTDVAGHHTNLYPQKNEPNGPAGSRTVELFHNAGVPYEKMVLGSAFYGRKWTGLLSSKDEGLGQKASSLGTGGNGYDKLRDEFVDKNGYHRYWDENACAPYLYNGETFISYEDPESIKAKCEFVKEKGLMGMMYWAYGSHDLFEAMVEGLSE